MKVAVITGAASGIGLALSRVNLQGDVTVVMVDKNAAQLDKVAEQLQIEFPGKAIALYCDVTKAVEVAQLVEDINKQLGRVDWIYNNAGMIGQIAPVWELEAAQLHHVMEVNLYGMIHIIQAFTPLLFQQNFRSHIINMASLYGLSTSTQTGPYSMSKHAVLALSESLHFDLNCFDKPVDVSVIFPSFTNTALLSNSTGNNSAFHDALKSLFSHSQSAMDLATHIVQEVEQKKFYLFPDKEVKGYYEKRTHAILLQEKPHASKVERLMSALIKENCIPTSLALTEHI